MTATTEFLLDIACLLVCGAIPAATLIGYALAARKTKELS